LLNNVINYFSSVILPYGLHSSCFSALGNKRAYSETNIGDHGPGTQIQVTLSDLLHYGRDYMSFYSHRIEESYKSKPFAKYIDVDI
jgi:hypothetical protein